MLAQFVVRSVSGRIITHTPSMRHAFEFSTHWSRYMGAPCKVTNQHTHCTVSITPSGHVKESN